MRTQCHKLTAILMILGMVFSPSVWADPGEVAALKLQIQALTEKMAAMEEHIQKIESKNTGSEAPHYVVPAGDLSEKKGLLRLSQDITMGGHIDAQWSNNFRQPHTASAARNANGSQTNTMRVFDKTDGSFSLNNSKLYFEKKAENPGEGGFRTDIMMGEDALVVNSDADNNYFQLEQAYGEYIVPLKMFAGSKIMPDSFDIKAGRFTTLAGLEVIEAPDNWNISRSIMFGYAVPFSHTGVRTHASWFDKKVDTYLGLNNGWDLPIDNNSFKTVEGGLGYSLFDKVNMMHAIYWGGENDGANGGRRFLSSNTATWNMTDKLSIAGDFQIGSQREIQNPLDVEVNQHNNEWYGFAGYLKYKLTDKFALAYRGEIFRDTSLDRTALTDTIYEQTFTADYHLTDHLIARAEFRYDKSNDDAIFAGTNKSQSTLGAQMVYII